MPIGKMTTWKLNDDDYIYIDIEGDMMLGPNEQIVISKLTKREKFGDLASLTHLTRGALKKSIEKLHSKNLICYTKDDKLISDVILSDVGNLIILGRIEKLASFDTFYKAIAWKNKRNQKYPSKKTPKIEIEEVRGDIDGVVEGIEYLFELIEKSSPPATVEKILTQLPPEVRDHLNNRLVVRPG